MTRVIIRSKVDITLSTQCVWLGWMSLVGWKFFGGLWSASCQSDPLLLLQVSARQNYGWGPFWKYSFSVKQGLAEVGAPYGVDVAYEGVTFLWSFAKIQRKNNGLERWLEDPANWRSRKTWKIKKSLKILEYRRDKENLQRDLGTQGAQGTWLMELGMCRKLRPLAIMLDMMVSIMRAWR